MKTLRKECYMLNNDKHEFKAPRIIDNETIELTSENNLKRFHQLDRHVSG